MDFGVKSDLDYMNKELRVLSPSRIRNAKIDSSLSVAVTRALNGITHCVKKYILSVLGKGVAGKRLRINLKIGDEIHDSRMMQQV